MGKVKEEMLERLQKAAQMAGRDEWKVLTEWNKNLCRPEGTISIEEYIARMAKE